MGLCSFFCDPWSLLAAVFVGLVAFRLWYKASVGICTSTRRLDGKTVLVTGANTGIGLETARDLARRGARVILGCRDLQKSKLAQDDIIATSGNQNVVLYKLDLASLQSVREFAAKVVAEESRLDVLVNNAGAGGLGPHMSRDGLHRGLQVNHFGPFLLTLLLLDLIKKSAPSRIIFVSSLLHRIASLTPENMCFDKAKELSGMTIYSNSKLANILNANELARKLKGTGVTVNSLHPGLVNTDFWRRLPRIVIIILKQILSIFSKSTTEGAQTSIFLAASDEIEGISGKYFSDCKEASMSSAAYDEGLAKKIWEKSEELVKLKDSERFY